MQPVLSILVPALASRDWKPLVHELSRQALGLSKLAPAEILVEEDNGEAPSGVKRQNLLSRANGRYVAFVDDDDWVSSDYVQSLVTSALKGFDVVTFCLKMQPHNEVWRYTVASHDNRRCGVMAANHLCAWKTELARSVGWCPYLGYGDDQLWYKSLLASGLVKGEFHIPRVLYYYRYCEDVTVNQRSERIQFSRNYARGGLSLYWHGKQIMVQAGNGYDYQSNRLDGTVAVINPFGNRAYVPSSQLVEFGKVHIH